jgi:hypothetical protein
MKTKLFLTLAVIGSLIFSSCEVDPTTGELTLSINGLQDLGSDYTYEGWLIVDGAPVSAGLFDVDANGELTQTSFEIDIETLENATAYVLTIEPRPDNDPAPSDVHILAGDFSGSSVNLSVSHSSAIGTDFTAATGDYILATPTDGAMNTDENSGLWWLNPTGPSAGLDLPTLPAGWIYEGWVVIDGQPISTGRFSTPDGADDLSVYSGATAGPPFPGEDFLQNAPSGLTFPVDLSEKTAVISVEPVPDNSEAPFLLKPIVGAIPANALDHTLYSANNNAEATNPTGTVSR